MCAALLGCHPLHAEPSPPPGSHRPNAGGSARSMQLNANEGSAAATGSPYLSRTVTAGLLAFAQYLLQKSLPLCAQPVHVTALCMPCMSTACSATATADVQCFSTGTPERCCCWGGALGFTFGRAISTHARSLVHRLQALHSLLQPFNQSFHIYRCPQPAQAAYSYSHPLTV